MQEEQLVQSHDREGANKQDRVFVFAFLHINSPPSSCHRWLVCAGTGQPWDCAWCQLPLWPEQAALAAHSPSTGFLYQTWAICAIHSPWHLSHCQGRWQLFPLLWATVLHHLPPMVNPSRNVWKCISVSSMPYLKPKGTRQPQNVPPVTEAEPMVTKHLAL